MINPFASSPKYGTIYGLSLIHIYMGFGMSRQEQKRIDLIKQKYGGMRCV